MSWFQVEVNNTGLLGWIFNKFLPWIRKALWDLADSKILRVFCPIAVPLLKTWAVMVACVESLAWTVEMLAQVINSVSQNQVFQNPQAFSPQSSWIHYGVFIDRFVPLHEGISMIVFVILLWAQFFVVRTLKWIMRLI